MLQLVLCRSEAGCAPYTVVCLEEKRSWVYARCQPGGQLVGNGEYVVTAFVQLCLVAV